MCIYFTETNTILAKNALNAVIIVIFYYRILVLFELIFVSISYFMFVGFRIIREILESYTVIVLVVYIYLTKF